MHTVLILVMSFWKGSYVYHYKSTSQLPGYDVICILLRVAFAKNLVEMASLADKVDPSDLLILHEEVGTIASENPATTCATTQLKLTASSGKLIVC